MTRPDEELLEEFGDRFMGEIGEGVTITPPDTSLSTVPDEDDAVRAEPEAA